MKLIYQKIVMTLFALLFNSSVLAGDLSKPIHCPSIDMIKSQGLDWARYEKVRGYYYAMKEQSEYDSPGIQWSFIVSHIKGVNSEIEALEKARAALPTLAGNPNPIATESIFGPIWLCEYTLEGTDLVARATSIF